MRSKNPELMERIREFAEDYYEEHGETPSNKTIADAIGMGRSTVYYYLVEMAERHMISYVDGVISTERIEKFNQPINRAALVGSIPCGAPDEREAMVEEYIPLPVSIFGTGDYYALHASGDSMIDAGIDDGDLIIIQRQEKADLGDIVVALTDEHQSTLKRLQYDEKRKCYYLHPENSAHKDIYVKSLQIQGVARHVIKEL
jgi:repressor LexA